jgi:hypothetical protein
MIKEYLMQTICMSAWNHKVSHNCLHALIEAGYHKPRDIAFVRVSRLLRIPEVDANDVASMLFALNDAVFKARNISCPPGSFDLTREELAERVRKLCKEYRLDSKPKKLLSLTAKELIKIANHDMAVIPQMVKKKTLHVRQARPGSTAEPPVDSEERTVRRSLVGRFV